MCMMTRHERQDTIIRLTELRRRFADLQATVNARPSRLATLDEAGQASSYDYEIARLESRLSADRPTLLSRIACAIALALMGV